MTHKLNSSAQVSCVWKKGAKDIKTEKGVMGSHEMREKQVGKCGGQLSFKPKERYLHSGF